MTDEEIMKKAIELAKISGDEGEVPVGAVVTKNGEIVATGRNRREIGKNALYHAELEAIDNACKALGGWRLWECELFVTLEPCPMCTGAIINARIPEVFYGAPDEKAGTCGTLMNLLGDERFNHRASVEKGCLGNECGKLLSDFFASLRIR